MPPETKRLEEENGRVRKLVADLSLDKEMLQDVLRRKTQGKTIGPKGLVAGGPDSGARPGFPDPGPCHISVAELQTDALPPRGSPFQGAM